MPNGRHRPHVPEPDALSTQSRRRHLPPAWRTVTGQTVVSIAGLQLTWRLQHRLVDRTTARPLVRGGVRGLRDVSVPDLLAFFVPNPNHPSIVGWLDTRCLAARREREEAAAAAARAAAAKAEAERAAAAAGQAEEACLAAENRALAVRPFIGGFFGKQPRQYDADDPADIGFDSNPVMRYGESHAGAKFGVAFRLGNSQGSLNPAAGIAGNLEEPQRSASFVDMPLAYNFRNGMHFGSGVSL